MTVKLSESAAREIERLARDRGLTPAELAAERLEDMAATAAFFAERAARAKPGAVLRILDPSRPGEPPRPGDEIE